MTKVTVYKNSEGDVIGFRCADHAGYAESGSDIVCAAVSALVLNACASIEQLTEDGFEGEEDEENAVISFRLTEGYSSDSVLLLNSLVLGLLNIAEENQEYISITFEEV